MKDLIIIGSHCPDFQRQEILNTCIDYLQSVRNDFDILISSHTIIPDFISNKVDYVFYGIIQSIKINHGLHQVALICIFNLYTLTSLILT